MGVVAHGTVGNVAKPLDLGLGVAGHVGQDAVIGEQGVDRLGVGGDHGVAQERVEVSGRTRRDLGGVGVRDLSAGTGQGSGFVGTATHRPRVRPDIEYMRDQELRRPGRGAGLLRPQRTARGGYSTRVGIYWPGVVRNGRAPDLRGVHPTLPQWPPTLVQYGRLTTSSSHRPSTRAAPQPATRRARRTAPGCSAGPPVAVALGFEPRVAMNHTDFRDLHLRPLGHATSPTRLHGRCPAPQRDVLRYQSRPTSCPAS